MALIKADRVKETSSSESTTNFILGGAAAGYRAFSSVCSPNDTFYYAIVHQTLGEWETGLGTFGLTGTLDRTTVHASSNANAKVVFSAGNKDCFITLTKNWVDSFLTATSGTTNYLTKTTGTGTIGDSQIYDNGTNVGIGTASPSDKLHVTGNIRSKQNTYYIGLTGDLPGYAAGTIPTLKSDAAKIWFSANSYAIGAWGTDTLFQGIEVYTTARAIGARINTDSSGSSYIANGLFGVGTSSPGAQLQVTTAAAATKGLIVKAASGQSTSLAEWQDANGYAIATINPAFSTTATDSGGQLFLSVNDAAGANIGPQLGLGGKYSGSTVTTFGAISAKKENATSGNYAGYLQLITSTHGVGNTEKVRITSAGNVGIGTTAPAGILHAVSNSSLTNPEADIGVYAFVINSNSTTNAGSALGLGANGSAGAVIVGQRVGANNETVMKLQTRNSAGAAGTRMTIDGSGNVGIGTSSPATTLAIASNGASPTISIYKSPDGVLRSNQQVASLGTGSSYTNSGSTGGAEYGILGLLHNGTVRCQLYAYAGGGGSNSFVLDAMSFGQTNASAGQVVVAPTSATTKGIVVKGASGQSANLQEWQNNSGTSLASIGADGSIYGTYGSIYNSTGAASGAFIGVSKWIGQDGQYINIRKLYGSRTIPTVVGDYVEIAKMGRYGSAPVTITIHACSASGLTGQAPKIYMFCTEGYYYGGGVIPPISSNVQAGGYGSFDFELEAVIDPTDANFLTYRIRRTVGTAQANCMFTIEIHNYNSSALLEASNTGTSTSPLSYLRTNNRFTNVTTPPPAGGSGAGVDLNVTAGSAAGTGNGGNVLLQAGAYSTSGSNGKVIVRGLASNTANLQEWQNNAGTALASVDSSGRLTIASSATASNADLYINNSSSVNPAIKWNGVSGQTGLRFYSGSSLIAAVQDNGALRATTLQTWGGVIIGDYYITRTGSGSISFGADVNGAGADISTGSNSTLPIATRVNTTFSTTKGLVVKGAASQTANLQEWQNNSGTALASIDSAGNFGVNSITSTGAFDTYFDGWYGAVKRRVYRVNVPSTIGNYQEIFRLNWSSNVIAKIKVLAFGNGIANAKEYDFNSSYGMTGVLVPLRSAYLYNTVAVQYELENDWNAGTGWNTIRVKRTSGTDALNLFVYVEVLDATSGHPQAVSGTGTSSIGGILGSYASYTSIAPPDVVGGNGNGYQLSLYGGNALGTGNGGNILLQAGALSTSGSNGKVIVRGLASNTANLQEWQNNAGAALVTVSSTGKLGIGVSPDTSSSIMASSHINAAGGVIAAFGAYDLNIGYSGPTIRRGFGNGQSLELGEAAANQPAFSFSAVPNHGAAGIARFTCTAATNTGVVVRGSASQTANLQEWQNSSGTALASVDASGNIKTSGSIQITSNTPSAFTADQNDLALSASGFQRLSGTAARNITGIAPPSGSHVDGRMMRIYNVGTYNLTLKHNSTSSSAPNRFYNVQAIDIIVGPNDYAELIYDGTNNGSGAAGWRVA